MPAVGPISSDRLKSFIERIERLREEKKAIGGDERDVFSEAKGVGFDTKAMREVLKRRAMDASARDEWDSLVDTYEHALAERGEAARIVSAGGTYEEAASKTGLSRATVARAVASRKNLENETPHHPETGEITTEFAGAEPQATEGRRTTGDTVPAPPPESCGVGESRPDTSLVGEVNAPCRGRENENGHGSRSTPDPASGVANGAPGPDSSSSAARSGPQQCEPPSDILGVNRRTESRDQEALGPRSGTAGVAPGPQDLNADVDAAVERAFLKSVEIVDDLTIPDFLRRTA